MVVQTMPRGRIMRRSFSDRLFIHWPFIHRLFGNRSFGVGKSVGSALALTLLLVGCELAGTYQPPLLPFELTLASDGSITWSAKSEIVTPLGTFGVQTSGSKKIQAPPGGTLLVVRHPIRGVAMDSVFGIHVADKLRFLTDGDSAITTNRNVVTLNLRSNVHGVRIQNVQQVKSAPQYATQQVKVLPPAPKAAAPTASPTGPGSSSGSPTVGACQPAPTPIPAPSAPSPASCAVSTIVPSVDPSKSAAATPSRTPSATPAATPSAAPAATPSKALSPTSAGSTPKPPVQAPTLTVSTGHATALLS